LIARTAALYLLVFVCVLIALDAGAYLFVQREYVSFLGPALGTPEGNAGLASAMRHVAVTILTINVPLVIVFGLASYVLARAAIAPITAARERERIFAADAAHELRSPLTAIAASAQAARTTADPQSAAAFESITHTALEASELVSDLLTLARDPNRAVLMCEPVDLAAVTLSCVRETQAAAGARGVRLDSATQSAIVDGDERRLKELVRNLLENAIRHARGSVRVATHGNGKTCEIVIDDDGEGVPAPDRERIFERFYRRSQDGSGTGLGLAIVAWIVRAHEGTITVGTAPEGGARFVATLPACHPERSAEGMSS
jgi:signal transduction histidine kinase